MVVEIDTVLRIGRITIGGYPRYLVLKERLRLNLELILETANEKGYRIDIRGLPARWGD